MRYESGKAPLRRVVVRRRRDNIVSDDIGCGASRSTVRALVTMTQCDGAVALATFACPLTMARTDGRQSRVQAMDIVPALSDPITVASSGPTTPTSPTTVIIPPVKRN